MKPSIAATAALIISALSTGAVATSVAAEDWNTLSASARVAYLADLSSIAVVGDDTTIQIARIALPLAVGDYSHKINEYAVRCGTNQFRIVMEVEYGADGAEIDRYPDPEAAWDTPSADSFGAIVKSIACDSKRGEGANTDSIKTYIDGRHAQ